MTLSVSYYTGADVKTGQTYGGQISRVDVTLSGTSASCGTVPPGAALARIKAGEACYVSNNNVTASSTNGELLAANDIIDLAVPNGGGPFLARTV